jgi:transposase-like protein
MSKKPIRTISREFKLEAVRRLLAGENVSALARELKVQRNDLYVWRDRFRLGGADALRGPGRPRKAEAIVPAAGDAAASQLDAAHGRIAELERKIGQQQLELDFFRQALRQVKGARRSSDGPGVTGSTRSSKR